MRYFIVSDVHGFYKPLIESLEQAEFDKDNPSHMFVSLGDLLDRGADTIRCLEFVNSLERKILIKGNHEDLLDECLWREEFLRHDYHNGTVQTVLDLCENTRGNIPLKSLDYVFEYARKNPLWLKYRQQLVDYAEIQNYVFVHGWIPTSCNDWRKAPSVNWKEARWLNGMANYKRYPADKTVVCGHYHTSWGHSVVFHKCSEFDDDAIFTPFIDNGIVAIDGCVAYTKKINCIVIDENDDEKQN